MSTSQEPHHRGPRQLLNFAATEATILRDAQEVVIDNTESARSAIQRIGSLFALFAALHLERPSHLV